MTSQYHDPGHVARAVNDGRHREFIGGMWDEIGRLQLDFLIGEGLLPERRLLDVGCGALRLGVRAVRYLAPGGYVGTDLNAGLLDAGYDREIVAAGLADRLPRSNLVVDPGFAFPGIAGPFDMAMAQSVFTHLPLNDLLLCVRALASRRLCRVLYFTVFPAADRAAWAAPILHASGAQTYPCADPYHYTLDDLRYCAMAGGAAGLDAIGDWGHPRGQTIHRIRFAD